MIDHDDCEEGKPREPGPPCHWCGKESCGMSQDKPFCKEHLQEALAAFARGIVNQDRFGNDML